jgi:hypothetical protein
MPFFICFIIRKFTPLERIFTFHIIGAGERGMYGGTIVILDLEYAVYLGYESTCRNNV